MKSFLEEYGFAILAAIVVILLIAMCTPVGNLIKNQITSVVDSFASKTTSKLDSIDAGDVSVAVVQDASGKFTLTVTPNSKTDTFSLYVKGRESSQSFNDIEWGGAVESNVGLKTNGGETETTSSYATLSYTVSEASISYVKFKIVNDGTGNVVFESQEYAVK